MVTNYDTTYMVKMDRVEICKWEILGSILCCLKWHDKHISGLTGKAY